MKNKEIVVYNTPVNIRLDKNEQDYISLTDIAKHQDPEKTRYIIQNWLRSKSTIEFLGLWEELNNPNFNRIEFDAVKNAAGSNSFVMTPKQWIEKTNAIGIISSSGRYHSGTYAHKDIAFEFCSWFSPVFKLYLIKEYQRLIEFERSNLALSWDVKRLLSKTNYHIHTDAIKNMIIPKVGISQMKQGIIYANEADLLNLAVFGYTAKQWEEVNPELSKKGMNIRDTASINQLVVLANIESLNAELIKQGLPKERRLSILHKSAKEQLSILIANNTEQNFKKLSGENPKQIE